jgi:hypothetical protein
VTGANVTSAPNVTRTAIRLQGQRLGYVNRVSFGGRIISNDDSNDVRFGYVRADSDTQVSVIPPQGMPIGIHQVLVGNGACWSSPISITLTEPAAPALVSPVELEIAEPVRLFGAKGAGNSMQSQLQLVISTSSVPSVLPNVVSLGLGNQFTDMFLWPTAQPVDGQSRTAWWEIAPPAGLHGMELYAEIAVADFGAVNPLPLPTSSTIRMVVQ